MTTEEQSARGILNSYLGQYGLGSLADWAWQKWQAGESIDQIMLELRSTPEYKQRFPAMDALAAKGRAITEQQYLYYEQQATSYFRAAGLPSGFYDQPDDFAKLLTSEVGLPELQARVQAYQQAAFSSPPEVLQSLKDLYGVTSGELTAFFIDPDKALPLIQQRFASAQAAGWAEKTGFGTLDQQQAEMIGKMGLTENQVAQQFGQIAASNELFNPLAGADESTIDRNTVLGAAFGQNAEDQRVLEQRKQSRVSGFAGGGKAATNREGVSGAGAAR